MSWEISPTYPRDIIANLFIFEPVFVIWTKHVVNILCTRNSHAAEVYISYQIVYLLTHDFLLLLATTDEWEEICIVPITEEVSMAIQSVDYQSLLLSIGMQPPSDMVSVCVV